MIIVLCLPVACPVNVLMKTPMNSVVDVDRLVVLVESRHEIYNVALYNELIKTF